MSPPVLSPDETRRILDGIDRTKIVGLRDRALIGVLVFTFARISAAVSMKVADVFVQNDRLWVRLHEKGGKLHTMPCQHNLEAYLKAYLDTSDRAGQPKLPLLSTPEQNQATAPLHWPTIAAVLTRCFPHWAGRASN